MPTTPLGFTFAGIAAVFMALAILGALFNDMHNTDMAQRVGVMMIVSALFSIASGLWR